MDCSLFRATVSHLSKHCAHSSRFKLVLYRSNHFKHNDALKGSHPAEPSSPLPIRAREKVDHSHLCPRSMDHPKFKWLQNQIPLHYAAIGIFHVVRPLEGSMVQTEDEQPPHQVVPQCSPQPPVRSFGLKEKEKEKGREKLGVWRGSSQRSHLPAGTAFSIKPDLRHPFG